MRADTPSLSHFGCLVCVCLIPGAQRGVGGYQLHIPIIYLISRILQFVNSKARAQKPQTPLGIRARIRIRISGFRNSKSLTIWQLHQFPRRTLSSASFCILVPLVKIFTFPREQRYGVFPNQKSESFSPPVKLMRFCVLISDGSIWVGWRWEWELGGWWFCLIEVLGKKRLT